MISEKQANFTTLLTKYTFGLSANSILVGECSGLNKECSVTDLVSYLPLERGAKYWAEEIYKAKDYNRYDRLDEIKKAGYDARTSAVDLQNKYIELYK